MPTPGLASSAQPSIEEVLFMFDLNGFIILPSVLSHCECDGILSEIKDSIKYRKDAESSGQAFGTAFAPGITRPYPNVNELKHKSEKRGYGSHDSWLSFAGQAGTLLDHPTLVPILHALIGESPAPVNDDGSYNFRCDDSMTVWREAGFTAGDATQNPHGGGGQRARAMGCKCASKSSIFCVLHYTHLALKRVWAIYNLLAYVPSCTLHYTIKCCRPCRERIHTSRRHTRGLGVDWCPHRDMWWHVVTARQSQSRV